MELKNLLSVVIAALTAQGAMLFAMGSQNPWLAFALWLAAVVSLVVTDFLGAVRVPRNVASLLMWAMLAVFLPHFLMQHDWDSKLQSVAGVLIFLQMALLFQEKDSRVYGWLAVMSLLQAVVAARYSQGVAFGGLLVAYAITGIFALCLLAFFSQWGSFRSETEGRRQAVPAQIVTPETTIRRWPLAAMKPSFTSAPSGTGRSGIVTELFARLALIALGGLLMATIIFYTVPRRQSAYRVGTKTPVATVGFNDQITLGGLGETLESPEEVMQLKLIDGATDQVYPMRDEIYLRGSTVIWYAENHWRRNPPKTIPKEVGRHTPEKSKEKLTSQNIKAGNETQFRIGPPVVQRITMEPNLDRNDLFYVWPLVEPVEQSLFFDPTGDRLMWSGAPLGEHPQCEVVTSGLIDGHQAELIPASREVDIAPCLQMPVDRASLPRLTALAARWMRESGLAADRHYDVARRFERQLGNSGQFQYSLQEVERDSSIDAIEDFVSNNPRGHCEYFATALALMLRSQNIPARVVMGYRCDEWHEDQHYYQVRQLHAHAWVEAFLSPDQIPHAERLGKRVLWKCGGWLRLDPTPAGEVGTQAAERTFLGAWQGHWHGIERYWDKYIVDLDRDRQQESVYEPIYRATRNITAKLFNLRWWRDLAAGLWSSLAALLRHGIMGWLFGVVTLIAISILALASGWWLVRRIGRLWRRFTGGGGRQLARARTSIEFYHRFEQIAARLGLQRATGQTPREFARAAGTRLASATGRGTLFTRSAEIAEAFYLVRFGQQAMDASAAERIEQALAELTAGAEIIGSKVE